MLNKIIKTIHSGRLLLLLVISIGVLYYIGLNPIDLGRFLGAKFGSAVGMNMSVPENPINRLALQLQEKEDELNRREQALALRETDGATHIDQTALNIVLVTGVAVLFLLIALNYFLDYWRRKQSRSNSQKK